MALAPHLFPQHPEEAGHPGALTYPGSQEHRTTGVLIGPGSQEHRITEEAQLQKLGHTHEHWGSGTLKVTVEATTSSPTPSITGTHIGTRETQTPAHPEERILSSLYLFPEQTQGSGLLTLPTSAAP